MPSNVSAALDACPGQSSNRNSGVRGRVSGGIMGGVEGRAVRVVVVVVDDDDVNRRGIAELLDARHDVTVLAALTHSDAMRWTEGWREVNVLLVDAADERAADDQFPGVAVVERFRRYRAPGQATVVVVTGHFFDDAVRRRMREARADFFYHRTEFADASVLYRAVLSPESCRRVPEACDPEEQFRQGVTDATRVNRAVAHALGGGLAAALRDRSQPRRTWLRLRRDFNRQAGLSPVTIDGRRPDRAQALPSVPQIERFLTWATRVKRDRPGG
jgi:CheY-like chemotaxis protein